MNTDYATDIPTSLAYAAHAGTSFVPEDRARQEREGYAATLSGLYAELLTHADTPEKQATLDEEFSRFREGYRKRYTAHLASRSRCISAMIAGPSNFPARRMEKRNAVAQRRLEELLDFEKRAKDAILKALHPEWRPIMSGDANAAERLKEKILAAEAEQEKMRAANAAIRKHRKAGADAQTAALVALGFCSRVAVELLQPDFCGRIGFADFQLQNNNANIRRMKQRLDQVTANQAKPETQAEGEHARLEDSPADNRVRLFFPGKPSEEVRTRLTRSGFRWSPTIGAWQAYRNSWTHEEARKIAGIAATH